MEKDNYEKRIPNTVVDIPEGYALSASFEEDGKLHLIWARAIDFSKEFGI